MVDKTVKAELVAIQEEYPYTIYVFQDVNTLEYFMCTRFPNWEGRPLQMNEIGFVNYRIVVAGRDTWYDKINNIHIPYKYNGFHFINFVPYTIKSNEIIVKK